MGLAAAVTTVVASILPDALAFAAPEIAGSLLGAGGGALLGGITGGDPGMGALGGAITGGFIPAGGEILGPALGTTAGSAIGGLAGGALGAGVTGGNPLVGAAEGGISGGLSGALSGGTTPGTSTPPGTAPTAGAGAAGSGAGGGFGAPLSGLSGGAADAAGSSLLGATSPDALTAAINATAPPAASLAGPSLIGAATPSALGSAINATAPPTGASLLSSLGPAAAPATALGGGGAASPTALPTAAPGASPLATAAIAANNAGGGNLGGAGTPTITEGGGGTDILGKLGSFAKNNPLLTTGASLLGSQLLSPVLGNIGGANKLTPAEQQLLGAEQPGVNAANTLVGSLQSGQLPPGADAAVDQALQADIANIKSRYASMGMSGSSSEQQDIANAQNNAAAQKFQLANQATQTGLSALGLNQQVYQTLVQDQLAKQGNLSNAISNFFGSVGTGTALGQALNNKAA